MVPQAQHIGTFVRVVVDEAVGSFAQRQLDETLGLAVRLRTVRSCMEVPEFQGCAGTAEAPATEGRAVIGQQCLGPGAQRGVAGVRVRQKRQAFCRDTARWSSTATSSTS